MSRVAKLADEFCRELSEFDPALYSPDECTRIAESCARVAKACGVVSARAVLRGSKSGRPEKLLSEMQGSSVGAARDALRAVVSVESGSETDRALTSGEISAAQAAEIVKAPMEEHDELTSLARNSALQPVRDEARRRTLRRIQPDQLHEKQHSARHVRASSNDLGNTRLSVELPPEVGVPWVNRFDREVDRAWRDARRAGRTDTREQIAADVFVRMTSGGATPAKTDIVFVIDINAYRRGHAHDGEPCHIIGGGPIPVDIVREMVKDAFIKAVIHDGVNVHTVKHFGRHRPAALQTILDLGPPPDFTGASCRECGRKYNLQWDHIDPVANGGPTCYVNAQALCIPDHVAKTERDRKAGLLKRRPQGP